LERTHCLVESTVSNIKRLSHIGKKRADIIAWDTANVPAPKEMTTSVQKVLFAVVIFITKGTAEFGRSTRSPGRDQPRIQVNSSKQILSYILSKFSEVCGVLFKWVNISWRGFLARIVHSCKLKQGTY
jgi:hypothetical protein